MGSINPIWISHTCRVCHERIDREEYRARQERNDHYFHMRQESIEWRFEASLLPAPKKKSMDSISKVIKRMLDADTKVLIKAEYLDEDLEFTEEGIQFVLAHYLQAHKKELATEARKELKEQKEEE